MSLQSVDPRTGTPFGDVIPETTSDELDQIATAASAAAGAWSLTTGAKRATALRAVADRLDARSGELVEIADRETGLGSMRLAGEVGRSTFQLRMFADLVESGGHLGVTIDHAVPGAPPTGHPDLRRMNVALGPVAVFAASNFPFAFGVPGGDAASALAAGCPVVVKAHPSHPRTSIVAGEVFGDALSAAGAPVGTFAVVHGMEAGRELVLTPAIRAAAFTGSGAGGRALFDLASNRPVPIPFYGELGSVNPVVVTPEGAPDGSLFASAYVDSLTMGTGQFCTNPGLLLVPSGSGLTERITVEASRREPGVLLNAGIVGHLHDEVARLAALPGVRTLLAAPGPTTGGYRAGPVILATDGTAAMAQPELLRTECFGPAAVIVEYASEEELLAVLGLLDGCLVATVHGDEVEPLSATLISTLSGIAGRVLWNDWPTGVAVTAGQHHGGPFPATTNSLHTSVGTAAVLRFLRPVAFQSVPGALLPTALQD